MVRVRHPGMRQVRGPSEIPRPSVETNESPNDLLGRVDELGRTRRRYGPPNPGPVILEQIK